MKKSICLRFLLWLVTALLFLLLTRLRGTASPMAGLLLLLLCRPSAGSRRSWHGAAWRFP